MDSILPTSADISGDLLSHDVRDRHDQHPVRVRRRYRRDHRQQPSRMRPLLACLRNCVCAPVCVRVHRRRRRRAEDVAVVATPSGTAHPIDRSAAALTTPGFLRPPPSPLGNSISVRFVP